MNRFHFITEDGQHGLSPSLDIEGILRTIRNSPFRRMSTGSLANRRSVPTRGKKSTTDHPPIHPTGAATREMLGDDAFSIYELVLRRFPCHPRTGARWKNPENPVRCLWVRIHGYGGQLIEPGWHCRLPVPAKHRNRSCPCSQPVNNSDTEGKTDKKRTQPPARYTQSKLISG